MLMEYVHGPPAALTKICILKYSKCFMHFNFCDAFVYQAYGLYSLYPNSSLFTASSDSSLQRNYFLLLMMTDIY